MPFTPLTFQQIVELLATQYAAQAELPANTNQGSALGSIFNAVGLLTLNIQNELLYVDKISRMLTSTGADIDTWGAQFNLPRIGATPSSGTVTFTTSMPVTAQLIIPVGGIVQTSGGLLFQVIAPLNSTDPNFANYSAVLGGYVIQVSDSSVTATVQCLSNGTIGNVAAGTISESGSTGTSPLILGVDTIANALAFTNGLGSETDIAYQTRLTLALSTGTVATPNAVAAAILGVQPGLTYSIGDGLNTSGAPAVGQFTVVVNELGLNVSPPGSLLASVAAAVNLKRAAGISSTVIGPSIIPVDVTATIKITSTSSVSVTQALSNIQALVQEYLNGIGLDPAGGLTLSEISELYVVMRTYPNVTNVNGVAQRTGANAFNQSDISAGFAQQLVAGVVNLTPG